MRDVLLASYDNSDQSGLNTLLLVALARTALVDASARDVLLDALQAQDPWLRCVAAACCCYDGAETFRQDDEFIGALAADADFPNLNLAFPAIRALSLCGLDHPVVAHAIDQRIERGDRDVRIATYGVLDRFASPSGAAVDRLLVGCAAPEPGVRVRCIQKLAEHAADARSLPAIRRALEDADSGVRLSTLESLVDVMPRGAAFEHVLERCASDENRWVRELAAEQLRLLREGTSSER